MPSARPIRARHGTAAEMRQCPLRRAFIAANGGDDPLSSSKFFFFRTVVIDKVLSILQLCYLYALPENIKCKH